MTIPINPKLAFGLLLSILLVASYTVSAWSLGRLFIRWRSSEKQPVVMTYAFGHALLAVMLQLMALAGLIHWYLLIPLLGIVVALNFKLHGVPDLTWEKHDLFPKSRPGQVLACSTILLICFVAVITFSFPGTDALAYYMAQPKLIATTGHYTPLPGYEYFATLPAIAEMPYAFMYCLANDSFGWVAAKLSMWPVFVAVLALLWQLVRRLGVSTQAAWMFVALGTTSTAITLVAWDGKTDLIGVMYALSAAVLLPGLSADSRPRSAGIAANFPQPSQSFPWFMGWMAACAVMAKLSFLLILPFCLGVPLILLWRRQPKRCTQFVIKSCLAAAGAFMLGWWFKNFVLFTDPFAPLLNFRASTPEFALEQVWFSPENTRWLLMTYPLALIFGNYPLQHGGLSPIWLVLFPTIAMRPWKSEAGLKSLYLACGGLTGMMAWMLLRPSVIAPRYFLPTLLLLCPILVLGLDQWWQKKRLWAVTATVTSVIILLLHCNYVYYVCKYTTLPLLRTFDGIVGVTPLLDRANKLISDPRPEVKVLLLSYSSEFLPKKMLLSFIVLFDESRTDNSPNAKPIGKDESILEFALREKVDYIVYDPITHSRDDLDITAPPGLVVEKLEYAKDVYYLYALERQDATN